MLCPSCGADLPDDSYYCAECGAQLDEKAFNAQYAAPGASAPQSHAYSDVDDAESLSLSDSLFRPFKDPDWLKKVLIASLFGLIPFFGQLIGMVLFLGFQVDYIRKILNRNRTGVLPEWNDWSALLTSGIMLWLVNAVYGLGVYFICGIAFIPFIGAIIAMWEQLQNASPETAFGILFGALSVPILISSIVICIFSTFAFLIPVFYARNKNFGDAFQFGAMFRMIMADLGNFAMTALALFGISVGAVIVLGIPMGILFFILSFIPILGQILYYFISGFVSMGFMFVIMLMSSSAFAEYYHKNRAVA